MLALVIVLCAIGLALVVAYSTRTLKKGLHHMSEALKRLTLEVSESRTATASAIALVVGLAAQLREAIDNGDDEALNALADSLDASTNELAAAVTANTEHGGPDTTAGQATDFDPTSDDGAINTGATGSDSISEATSGDGSIDPGRGNDPAAV